MIYQRGLLDHVQAERARRHALRRLRERFGIELDMAGLRSIEAGLLAGRYRWITVSPRRHTIAFEVAIGAVTTVALFNFRLLAIATFVERIKARPAIGRTGAR